jgi:transposase IS116/IS110/IS902 family protein
VAPLLETIDHLNEQIRYYDEMEEHIAREQYPKYRLLEQVNGVGVHTALLFMLTIGDAERFEKSRMVGSFLGLRPKKQESGESKPQLGITKAGLSRRLRKLEERFAPQVENRLVVRYDGPGSEGLPQPRAEDIDENTRMILAVRFVAAPDVRPCGSPASASGS